MGAEILGKTKAVYENHCETRFAPASEDAVAQLEETLSCRLPPDYRLYLRMYNGGRFDDLPFRHSIPGARGDCLTVMFGLNSTDKGSELNSPANLGRFDDNDPAIVLPIGYTAMGHLLLLTLAQDDDDYGEICLKPAYKLEFHTLAESIDEFFGLIELKP